MQTFIKSVAVALCVLSTFQGANAQNRPENKEGKTIVFIHGMFQNSHSWDNWMAYFERLGYICHAPSYPYHAGKPDSLWQHINPRLTNLEFGELLDSMNRFIDRFPERPIVVGHSIGGLVVQKLVEAGKAKMGICIAPANPNGINVLNWKFIRSNFRMVNPLMDRNKVCSPPPRWFRYTFFNTLSDSAATAEYQKYFVPESRKLAKSSNYKEFAINFDKPHVPLLFISGEQDNDLPPVLIKKNFQAYTDKHSIKSYRQFPGRSHYICSEPKWQEVADYIADWIEKNESGFTRNE